MLIQLKLGMYKLGAFEFLEAIEHIIVQQWYIFGEISSHLPLFGCN